mmetsp:Transcript_30085/g.68987  ORF Transcript_30085/g.68987 Transcript_30085/m.68987 type:complete len:80 (-) Transcript_30085:307-546(-)
MTKKIKRRRCRHRNHRHPHRLPPNSHAFRNIPTSIMSAAVDTRIISTGWDPTPNGGGAGGEALNSTSVELSGKAVSPRL